MTLQAMQEHELVTLSYAKTDYRRQGAIRLALDHVSGSDVLDMRCLEGELSVVLALEGRKVVGLDGFAGAVERTNEEATRNGINQQIAQVWSLTDLYKHVGDKKFDSVLCLDLLNHVDNDRNTLQEISEVVKPGGKLIILAPAFPALLGKRDESLGHLRRYKKKELVKLLDEFGFKADLCRYWNALALPGYVLIENIFKRIISDKVRYSGSANSNAILGPLLRFWYKNVERRISPPFGLSLFVVARKV